MHPTRLSRFPRGTGWLWAALLLTLPAGIAAQTPFCSPSNTITADVVALDQVFFWNRLGAVQPQGMMFALRRDVVSTSGSSVLQSGSVQLRPDKRPRPLVLRMHAGGCLHIKFQNLLRSSRVVTDPNGLFAEQPATRYASVHVMGLQLVQSELDDGSYVGTNDSSLVPPGGSAEYLLYAGREGEHLLYSMGTTTGGEGDGGQLNAGLFGAVIVEPAGSRWYRSQVTRSDLDHATTGTSTYGHPTINYAARYPATHKYANKPILDMLDGQEIVHSDLTAIIAGFPSTTYPAIPNIVPDRTQPFREYVIIYHDETGAVQAFPVFYDKVLSHTLHSVRDAFAINYGSAGAGAEIFANRIKVGPMHNCVECKYEEFFLTSWAVGDPAMVVDKPANFPCTTAQILSAGPPNYVPNPCTPQMGAKATKAFYPDDPSNVYHGYLNDHTKFRVLHGGSAEHHIHHLHAHQWLYSPDNDKSSYLDSQAIGPGGSFTAEIAYGGAGNLNRTPGDSIFHCHFYPHFAQGMWALWRVHDVFEQGTILDSAGLPTTGANRALPDSEIVRGTPIPAVVPMPGLAMPPLPKATVSIVNGEVQVTNFSGSADATPGFPFFIPGKIGHRPPRPPKDVIDDGGLQRHVVAGGTIKSEAHTRHDFHKELDTLIVSQIAENGTAIETREMSFHQKGNHPTCTPEGICGVNFRVNGLLGRRGAPFAPPCTTVSRTYKGADIEDDVIFNKVGWHFPQQRFSALWEDVDDFLGLNGGVKKPPEPLFFRANSGDCIEYQFTNLVPKEYKWDDFQVRTPTDILGQHIHLVKFDVLASDGGGNGWNYEDGSFSPGEVRERIDAVRKQNGCLPVDARNGTFPCPVAKTHPFFGPGPDKDGVPGGDWIGAQTTVQLWYADPIKDNSGKDRTLRTVFTHDHFGPSTHQQAGLYAGLVIEPAGSTWKHNETGEPFGARSDGGPTSWQAVIDPPLDPAYREFLLEFGDFQLAYNRDSEPCNELTHSCVDIYNSINPPGRHEIPLSVNNDLLRRPLFGDCPGNVDAPCSEAVSAAEVGTMTVNYRNEPIALRVHDGRGNQSENEAGDLSFAFSSKYDRDIADLNTQPGFYPPLTADVKDRDPYTPLLRAYENDRVQIRVLVGAHEEGHNFSVHGIKWLQEPSNPNSGWRNSQMMGISEHFEFIVPQLIKKPAGEAVDRLWSAGSSTDDYWNGIWGILRAYTGPRPNNDLVLLPENPNGRSPIDPGAAGAWDFSCPKEAVKRYYTVKAVNAWQLFGGYILYNSRVDGAFPWLTDPTGIVYIRTDIPNAGFGHPNNKEPLVMRARAGECVVVTLTNDRQDPYSYDVDGYNTLPMIVDGFNANDIKPSAHVGLHPQLLYYDVSRFDGANVGDNNIVQTVPPGKSITYEWYAGDIKINSNGTITPTAVEFGATNLISSDRIEHAGKGAFGALIIEPADATWVEDAYPQTSQATVTSATSGTFRELVLQFQTDVNMQMDGDPVENLHQEDDAEDTGAKAVNYRSEPLWKRMQHDPDTPLSQTADLPDWWDVVSNSKVGTAQYMPPTALPGDPVTPVFRVAPGQDARIRLLQAGGHSRNIVFALHGHVWDKQPYIAESTKLGHNGFSMWEGSHTGLGPSDHFDILLRYGAGGAFETEADYLCRDFASFGFDAGLWALMRVRP